VTATDDGRFTLSPEQAFCLADPDGAVYLPGAFQLALGALRSEPRVTESFRTGAGMGWHEHDEEVFLGCEAFFRPGYVANVTAAWIPALGDVEERLQAGGRIADIGCGLGASSIIMAEAYPAARVSGSDYHEMSIERARERAAKASVTERVDFEVASATTFTGTGFDLVTSFDCLHDMGDPVAAARHVRAALAPEGCWMLGEPRAADDPAANLNPVGRMYYGFSTLLCVPNAISQGGHRVLGAQAGPRAIAEVTREAGFGSCERVSATPFNDVYAVRP
jgi:SAM-dependent methyltransferase